MIIGHQQAIIILPRVTFYAIYTQYIAYITRPEGLTVPFLMKCGRVMPYPVRTGLSSPKTCKLSLYFEVFTRAAYFPI